MKTTRCAVALLVSLGSAAEVHADQPDPHTQRTILFSGPAPSPLPPGSVVNNVHPSVAGYFDATGYLVLGASLQQGPGGVTSADNDFLLRSDALGALTVLHREGMTLSGAPPGAVTTDGLSDVSVNGPGEIAFEARLTGGGVTLNDDTGLWGPDGAGGLTMIMREGTQAAGVAVGALYSQTFGAPVLDDTGGVGFLARLSTGSGGVTSANDFAMWAPAGPGSVSLLAREGAAVPAVPGATYGTEGTGPLLASTGAAFRFRIVNPTGWAWFEPSGGGHVLVARDGAAAPGAGGALFSSLSPAVPAVFGAAGLAFRAPLTPGPVGALFGPNPLGGGLTLLLRQGDPVPGEPGEFFSFSFHDDVAVNDTGSVAAFVGERVVSIVAGVPITVARVGDQAPGMPAGITFNGFLDGTMRINDVGALAFEATLSNGTAGIFVRTATGYLTFIAPHGGPLEVAPGVIKIIDLLELSDGALDPDGNIAFYARTASQSGIFYVIPACADMTDTDGDGVGDPCDNCPSIPNPTQANADADNLGDACEGVVEVPALPPGLALALCALLGGLGAVAAARRVRTS